MEAEYFLLLKSDETALKLFLCLSVEKTKVGKTIIQIDYFDFILDYRINGYLEGYMDIMGLWIFQF